jgi:hypothetical protein
MEAANKRSLIDIGSSSIKPGTDIYIISPIFATIRRDTVAAAQWSGPASLQYTRYFASRRSCRSLTNFSLSARLRVVAFSRHGLLPGGTYDNRRAAEQIS